MNIFKNIRAALLWLLYLPVVLITYLIVWMDRKMKFRLGFPRDVEELAQQQAWCIAELKKAGVLPAQALILDYQVSVLNPDMIFRSNAGLVKIKFNLADGEKLLQCFAKFAPTMGTVWNKNIFNLQLNHIKESQFNEYFIKTDPEIPAPAVYVSKISLLTGHLCLITEFMTEKTEYTETVYTGFTEEHLNLALEGMACLHARFWNDRSPRMSKVMPIEASTVDLMEFLVRRSWSPNARKILSQSWRRMNEPQTIVHGDSRIGNMLFPAGNGKGRFVFIDWQAVRKGSAIYDLAYFLILSLYPDQRRRSEKRAFETYYMLLLEKGVKDYSREEAENDYQHACLCTLVLLSLPLLSGEASVEGEAVKIFITGMGVWQQHLVQKFEEFDYNWLAENYGMSPADARIAVQEMLNVIKSRLSKLANKAKVK